MKTLDTVLKEQLPSKTGQEMPSCVPQSKGGLPLKSDAESKKNLAMRLYRDFHAMKTYGKEPESLESIISLFNETLAEFTMDHIVLAMKVHAQRSQEFPTPADIVGIIRRKGRPPLSREMYISISKKDPEDRSGDDWKYLRAYEAEHSTEVSDFVDQAKETANRDENLRLRNQVRELQAEIGKLSHLLHESRRAKGLEKPKPSVQEQVNRTVAEMRRGGASEEDIERFAKQYGVTLESAA